VYVLLRYEFTSLPAFTGALLIVSHPLVMHYAFDGRMYGLLLLATCLFIYAVQPVGQLAPLRHLVIGAASVLLCLTHYFGVFAWVLVMAATGPGLRPDIAVRRFPSA